MDMYKKKALYIIFFILIILLLIPFYFYFLKKESYSIDTMNYVKINETIEPISYEKELLRELKEKNLIDNIENKYPSLIEISLSPYELNKIVDIETIFRYNLSIRKSKGFVSHEFDMP